MRHTCSGENTCGMVRTDKEGKIVSVSERMSICAGIVPFGFHGHCGLIRRNVSFFHGDPIKKKEVREETLYQSRMLPLFKDESKAEFIRRMKRAANGAWDRKPMMRQMY